MPGPAIVLDARVRRGGGRRYADDLLSVLPAVGQASFHAVSDGALRASFTPWGLRTVARKTDRAGADLLHGLHLEVAPVAVPAVVTIHDVIPLDHPSSMPSRVRRRMYRRTLDTALTRARRVLVPSEATARALARHGADPSQLCVVPLGTGPQFRPVTGAGRDEARRRFAEGRPYVLAMTGSRSHKNFPGVRAAAGRLRTAGDLAVVAPGERPESSAGAVRFLGRVDDPSLAQLYTGAEATLVASHVEGFGLPVLESLACGTPVVCGGGIGALPWLRPGLVVVDTTHSTEMADALLQLAFDPPLREALSEAGRAAAAPLTLEAMATATFAVYQQVLAEAWNAVR